MPDKDPISYRPMASGTRLGSEKDCLLSDAGRDSYDPGTVVKAVLLLVGLLLLVMFLGKVL